MTDSEGGLSRRELLQRAGALGAGALIIPGVLAACAREENGRTPRAEGTPRRGGTLRISDAGTGSSENLDPHGVSSFSPTVGISVQQLYDRLTVMGPDGSVKLALAEEFAPNSDATRWTIKLRSGVKWHDGKPLTADDVVFSLRRVLDPKFSIWSGLLPYTEPSNIRRLSQDTVEVRMNQPMSAFPESLSVAIMILQDGTKDFAKPVGTGPFKFKSFRPGEISVFTRNPDYWQSPAFVDEIVVRNIDDAEARANAVESGEIDIAMRVGINTALAFLSRGNLQALETEAFETNNFVGQIQQRPFNDIRVRQALKLAIDREAIIDTIGRGHAVVGNDVLIGPKVVGYNQDLPQHSYDPEQAKALLADAGYADGITLGLSTGASYPAAIDAATLFAEQAKAAGIRLTTETSPPEKFATDVYLQVPFFNDAWLLMPAPTILLVANAAGSFLNATGFDDPDFNDRFATYMRTVDETARQPMLDDLQQILWERDSNIVWGWLNTFELAGKNVRGWQPAGGQSDRINAQEIYLA